MLSEDTQCCSWLIAPPQLYHLLSSGLKERWTFQFRENPAKAQITLLYLWLRPIGKGALVMTGGPVGNGADGRFRRLEVDLCIMWPAIAVTVSVLSLPLWGSDPNIPLICAYDFLPFSFLESSQCREQWASWSCEMWLCCLSVFIHRLQSSCKEAFV